MNSDEHRRRARQYRAREASAESAAEAYVFRELAEAWEQLADEHERLERRRAD